MKRWFRALMYSMFNLLVAGNVYANGNGHEDEHFEMEYVIVTLGIITILSLIITASLGYFMPRKRNLIFPWHKRMAIVTLIAALSHALTVLLFD